MKKLALAAALAFVATNVAAGSYTPPVMEPVVEVETVEESTSSSAGGVVVVLLILAAAAVAIAAS